MSSSRAVSVHCPKCGRESAYTVWRSINTKLNPELKEAVRSGEAFRFTCPACGNSSHVEYDVLYHQMEDKLIVHSCHSDEHSSKLRVLYEGTGKEPALASFREDGYLIRIVNNGNQLREKLVIFDSGLDDRIIEIIKLLSLAQFQKSRDEPVDEMLFFKGDEQENLIALLGEGNDVATTSFPDVLYRDMEREFAPLLPDLRSELIVDQHWARNFLYMADREE